MFHGISFIHYHITLFCFHFVFYLHYYIDLNRPGWITIHAIMERMADEIKACLGADDIGGSNNTIASNSNRKVAQAAVSLGIILLFLFIILV